jgi:hypothetical protein
MINSKGIAWRIRRMIYLDIEHSFEEKLREIKKFGWVGPTPTQPLILLVPIYFIG